MNWANLVFVMQTGYGERIWGQYRHLELLPIEIFNIPDDYEFMDEELIALLTDRKNNTLEIAFKI